MRKSNKVFHSFDNLFTDQLIGGQSVIIWRYKIGGWINEITPTLIHGDDKVLGSVRELFWSELTWSQTNVSNLPKSRNNSRLQTVIVIEPDSIDSPESLVSLLSKFPWIFDSLDSLIPWFPWFLIPWFPWFPDSLVLVLVLVQENTRKFFVLVLEPKCTRGHLGK